MSQSVESERKGTKLSGPKYIQIRQRLLDQVDNGLIAVGRSLPKEKELALSFNVAVGTIRQALRGLEADGIIRRVPGKGTFINSAQERRERVKIEVFSLIVPFLYEDPIPLLIQGVEKTASEIDHQVWIGSSNNEVSTQLKLIHQSIENQVAGVIIAPTTFPVTPPDHIHLLQENHVPVVVCNRAVEGAEAPLVAWSHRGVGQIAARTLIEHGHRRIVALANMRDAFVDGAGEGVREVLEEQALDKSVYRLHCFGKLMREPSGIKEFCETVKDMLSGEDRPTAILCFNSFDAEQVYLLASEMGMKIPGDLSLIYFGGAFRGGGSALVQRITCVGAPQGEVGSQAVKMLQDIGAGRVPLCSRQKVEIPAVLLPGETVGPPRSRG